MKTLILLFFLSLAYIEAEAQYFKNYYEPNSMNSGLVTVSSGDGNLMSGIMADDRYFALVRTDKSGVFSAGGDFRKQYSVTYNSHTATITGVEAVEYDDGLGYGVLGSFRTDYSENGLFFAKVDLSGNITATHYLGSGTDPIVINAACVSHQRTRHMFGTGDLNTGGYYQYFYIEIDSTGAYVNGFIMDAQEGYTPIEPPYGPCPNPDEIHCYGIVESQFADPTDGEYYVVVVGKHYHSNTYKVNGFYMPVKPSLGFGAPIRVELTFPATPVPIIANNEWFTGVTALSDGYLISGMGENSGALGYNGWLTKLRGNGDPATTVVWSNEYVSPNSGVTTYDFELYDVKERVGQSQYCAIGLDQVNYNGSNLSEILLVTNTSGAVASGTSYDAGSQNVLFPVNIDIDYSTPGDGVALYAWEDAVLNPPYDMSLRKVQFNGNYDCNYNSYSPTAGSVSFNTAFSYGYGAAWSEGDITVSSGDEFDYDVVCYSPRPAAPAKPTGVLNATGSKNTLCKVYPNPALADQEIKLDLSSLANGTVEISLYNIVGKEVYRIKVDLTQTGKSITLPGKELDLHAGVYMLRLQSDGFSQNLPLVIK